MKAIILFDSYFGNTEQIARAIEKSLATNNDTKALRISEVSWNEIADIDLLIVGSPTRSFRPSDNTLNFLNVIPSKGLKGIKVAAFDTRLFLPKINSKFLRFIVKTGGYATRFIAKSLKNKGGELVVTPEGFLVSDEKGPLLNGELERARNWVKSFVNL